MLECSRSSFRQLSPTTFMHYVYVLLSKKDNKLYIGKTGDLRRRFKEHNDGLNLSTKNRVPERGKKVGGGKKTQTTPPPPLLEKKRGWAEGMVAGNARRQFCSL